MTVLAVILSTVPLVIHSKLKRIFLKIEETKLIDFDPILARYYFQHRTTDGDGDFERVRRVSYTDSQNRKIYLDVNPDLVEQKVSKNYGLNNWGNSDLLKYTRNQQLALFWFGSHKFIIYLMQSLLFVFVFYVVILLQFTTYFFNFSSALNTFGTLLRLVPIPVIVIIFPRSIPLYTIIINIGQMVDLRIVAEAFHKAKKFKEKKKQLKLNEPESSIELKQMASNDSSAASEFSPDRDFEASMTRKMTIEDSVGSLREDSMTHLSDCEDSVLGTPTARSAASKVPVKSYDWLDILTFLNKYLFLSSRWLNLVSLLIYGILNVESMQAVWIPLRWLNFVIGLIFILEYASRCMMFVYDHRQDDLLRFWHVFDGIAILLQFIMVIILLFVPEFVFMLLVTTLRLASMSHVEDDILRKDAVLLTASTRVIPAAVVHKGNAGGSIVVD
jgi:hypothetical protein